MSAPTPTPDQMLDWLERMANQPGGLLLHSEDKPTGRIVIGLANTGRTLRQAVADALAADHPQG